MIKIPLYFDDYTDEAKFNAVDKKFNNLLYNLDLNAVPKFLNDFPDYLRNNFIINKSSVQKYFYPIYISCYFFNYPDQYFLIIPKNIIKDIKNNKCKILIINIVEGYELSKYENLLNDKILKKYNLKFTDIILLTGNLIKTSKNGIRNIYYNAWENIVTTYNDSLYHTCSSNIQSSKNREYKFICLQRRPKVQRLMLYTELYDYRSQGILTMGIGDNAKDLVEIDNIEKHEFFNYKTLRKFQKQNLKSTLPCEYDVELATNNPTHDGNIEKYLNSYLHIVSETYFNHQEDRVFFSEKIYKPIVFMQPFVLFGQPYSLEYMKNLGFKTFHSRFIDESYDKIIDDKERFFAALHEVKRIISLPDIRLNYMMKYFLEILDHNYNNLLSRYYNNNTYYLELIEILNNR